MADFLPQGDSLPLPTETALFACAPVDNGVFSSKNQATGKWAKDQQRPQEPGRKPTHLF